MGEYSEYFEDFPEENPANFQSSKEPELGRMSEHFPQWHESQLTKAERAEVNATAEKEAEDKADYIKKAKTNPLLLTDICPQCHLKEMNIYKINDNSYFCECQDCGVSASGIDYKVVLGCIADTIWNQDT